MHNHMVSSDIHAAYYDTVPYRIEITNYEWTVICITQHSAGNIIFWIDVC